jgi:Cu(I)/Ag(I) efflux system membrane fusion protein
MKGGDIQSLRKNFQELSEGMMKYWTDFKPDWPEVFAFRCSMANDNKGAPWLQKGSELKNPYFGKAMSGCGTPLNK